MNKTSLRKLENDLGVAVETKKYTYGGNVYFIGFDNSEEYYKNHKYVYDFAKRHKMHLERNCYAWSFSLEDKKSRETRLKKCEKINFLNHIFEKVYHQTKNGDKAKQAQINFVNDHEEYKEAFEAFYS